ncbi:MAG: DUF4352 domain-containing protein [Patescibacteria group bacterium]|nr:DUF4352 domain-containing protein [Patescibacteria group bacterium]
MAEETIKCPKCKEEIAKDAKKCKHCGADLRNWFVRHKIWTGVLAFILLAVIMGAAGGGNSNNSTTKVGTDSQKETTYKVGDTISNGTFEITVTKAEVRSTIGDSFFAKSPSQGGTYVGVQYKFKNASDKPVASFSQPSFKLVDSKGTKYESDISASSSYATELKLDQKILSDLNPGITVNGADVYEINKEQYASGSWYVLVTANGKDYKVTVK